VTDEEFQDDNIDDELRQQGAGSGAPIQNIQDIGFEVGGPIKKGRAWFWGSDGRQDIEVGVVGFFKNDAACRPGGDPLDPRNHAHRPAAQLSRNRSHDAEQLQLEDYRDAVHEQSLQLPEHLGRKGPQRA
jgi:hypothetical protein